MAGAAAVGPLHLRLRRTPAVVGQHPQAGPAQVAGQNPRRPPRRVAEGDHERVDGRRVPRALGQRQDEPLDPRRETDARAVGSAELLHEAVVAAAPEQRVLRPEPGPENLEGGAHVVVEAPHQPVRHPVRQPVGVELAPHLREVVAAGFAQVVRGMRQRVDDRLVAGHLAVEDAQRVDVGPAPAVAAQVRHPLAEGREQGGAERGPAFAAPHRVDHQLARDAQLGHEGRGHLDHFRVDGRIGDAEHLDVELVELPVAALLGALVAEHRPQAVQLGERQGLLEAVLDEGADKAGGRLGPQGDALPALVGERVHLLLHDVR